MNSLVKVALIGGGAYLLYEMWPRLSSSAPANTTTSGPATTQPIQQAASGATRDLVYQTAAAAMGSGWNRLLTADQWNYYYQQARGVPGPDPLVVWPNQVRSTLMDVGQWWSGVSAHGVSGLGNYAIFGRPGLGVFVPMNLDRRRV